MVVAFGIYLPLSVTQLPYTRWPFYQYSFAVALLGAWAVARGGAVRSRQLAVPAIAAAFLIGPLGLGGPPSAPRAIAAAWSSSPDIGAARDVVSCISESGLTSMPTELLHVGPLETPVRAWPYPYETGGGFGTDIPLYDAVPTDLPRFALGDDREQPDLAARGYERIGTVYRYQLWALSGPSAARAGECLAEAGAAGG